MPTHILTLTNGKKVTVITPEQDKQKLMDELAKCKGWEFDENQGKISTQQLDE